MKSILIYLFIFFLFNVSAQEQRSVILMPKIMKKKEIVLMIKEKNNSELDRLAEKSRLFKNFQPVGFAAIPAGLLGAMTMRSSVANDNANPGSFRKSIGISLMALSAVCLSSSVYFNIQHRKNYKKAIQKYNQLYN